MERILRIINRRVILKFVSRVGFEVKFNLKTNEAKNPAYSI